MNLHRYLRPLFVLTIAATFVGCAQPEENTEAVEEATVRDLRGEEFTYEVDGEPYTGYIAYDAMSSGAPGVIVVHEWWGHNDYVRMRADMLAEMGYSALALDMYGAGKVADHPESAQAFATEVMNNLEAGQARFDAALQILKDHPSTDPELISAIGYCFGGGVVIEMARRGMDLDLVASFHGSLMTPTVPDPGDVKAKVLVFHGADDPFVGQEEVDGFTKQMNDAGADVTFVSYPGAVHAFTDTAATARGEAFGLPLRYNEAADKASWEAFSKAMIEVYGDNPAGD